MAIAVALPVLLPSPESYMRLLRPLLLLLALALPGALQAAPLNFVPDQGAMTLHVWAGNTLIASGQGQLDSGFLVFDPTTGVVSDLDLTAMNLAIWASALPGAYNALLLKMNVAPGAGFASTGDTTNPYNISIGPLDVAYLGSMVDATTPVTVPSVPIFGTLSVSALDVTILYDPATSRLSFQGVKLAEFVHNGVTLTVRGNIEFVGQPVPEPALAALALTGIAGLATFGRRRF